MSKSRALAAPARVLAACVIAFALATAASVAAAFPVAGEPIRILVGYAPGGPTDLQARAIAGELARQLGVPAVVENRPGASGSIAAAEVARAPADGHTLLYTVDGSMTQVPHLMKGLPYEPLKSLAVASRTATAGLVLVVHPSVAASNLPQLLAYLRANPGKVSYSSYGLGTSAHIYGELLSQAAAAEMVHVPYKGSTEAMKDVLAGRVQLMFDSPSVASQYVATGRMRMIGVVGEARRTTLPDVPTLLEQGTPGFEVRGWQGFFAPAGMPPAGLQSLNAALRRAQATPEVAGLLARTGFEPLDEPADDGAAVWRRDYQRWGEAIRRARVQIE